ncbi:MAG: ABC transporter permease [Firmicutes bacterium]|nr:ABC transporter permease [Bacillota bacterium]
MVLLSSLEWIRNNPLQFNKLLIQHLYLTFMAVVVSISVGVPLGILISHTKVLARPVINLANAFYSIPSAALFGLLVPIIGIGFKPAIIALVLYAQFIIINNTFVGLTNVEPSMLEAARGMGMKKWQQLLKVQLPLSLPVIFAGVRVATTLTIAMVAIAAYIGAGGLGVLIFRGIQSSNVVLIVVGALPLFVLSVVVDLCLVGLEKILVSKGLRV